MTILSDELINPKNSYSYDELLKYKSQAALIGNNDDRSLLLHSLVRRFLSQNQFLDALESVRLINNLDDYSEYYKLDSLILTARELANGKLYSIIPELLAEAESISNGDTSEWNRAETLIRIGQVYYAAGNGQEGMRLLEKAAHVAKGGEAALTEESKYNSYALRDISVNIMLMGDYEKSMNIASNIKHLSTRRRAIQNIEDIKSGKKISVYHRPLLS